MRGAKRLKSLSTCTESSEVDTTGMSREGGSPYPWRSDRVSPESGDREHREVRPSRQKSAEGIVGRLDAAEGPNTEQGLTPEPR